ncbi:Binding-protein-dependent transport system inner membrane component [Acididesulfobacillus acetoxydans]|uniref:ABC transporter, membrane spanning protein (Sugar) n=1 Tax=Acididesulfobacillus acetoxydans TaxID=1561005 RepID=A0A8S0VYJ1_9FIRM|nr:carbohydrate ABC transporter permease [Acididesulfobacillus acetoxydans]CAA7603073.1 Binding-protein-dependent transport system inner membrane component [Acididesulfobacillus acetoxydans]CEJ05689.1 ABC transporter, membrane spanning protein (Sugar) [Acididesulfobacillus acetoxydans]
MQNKRYYVGAYVQYIILALAFLGPVLWMVSSSFKNNVDITAYPPVILFKPTLNNYLNLFRVYPFGQYILNSFIITGFSTLLGLILGVPAAYAIARFRLNSIALLSLLARMAPGVLFLIPWYIISTSLHISSNDFADYLSLILAHCVITMPLVVWLMISYFESIPIDTEESAVIDGCSRWGLFFRIALPLSLPGLAVSTVLSFIFSWNYFLFALALANNATMPLTVIAFNFIGEGSADWGGLMAASTIISLPALILTIFAQKLLIKGLTAGAIKG